MELSENENETHQTLWGTERGVARGALKAVNAYLREA